MSIERYMAINLAADLALLGAVSYALGLFSWRRVLAASLLCAALSALATVSPEWRAGVALLSPALSALILTRPAPARLWTRCALAVYGHALLCGGIARLTPLTGPLAACVCLGAGGLTAFLAAGGSPPTCRDWQVSLCLSSGGRQARFPALIDTGNRLREPLSGLPVLIAEARVLRDILPPGGYRTLSFGGLGGIGRMACFRPDAVWIGRGTTRRRGPDIWVAVSPAPLPGLCQALAPPEFALYRR